MTSPVQPVVGACWPPVLARPVVVTYELLACGHAGWLAVWDDEYRGRNAPKRTRRCSDCRLGVPVEG